ncbi:autoinducer binding domain-containing protein [Pseudomonas fluorescens]|uniref:Transcriptional activator protein AnoR n=1 Tax=Pseudomonas fluorescens TaxID=294 RepID=A0A5E7DY30_PSEFL|nr:autoinducer binding domain-containing protein [Pseudomonas fluorescens]VVO17505.1 Transcriptional activator protein AnoR [Pseudomonas fluorescens]
MGCWAIDQVPHRDSELPENTIFEDFQLSAAQFGFEYCSMFVMTPANPTAPALLVRNSFPGTWNQHFKQQHGSQGNPVIEHCLRSVLPVLWSRSLFAALPALWDDLCHFGMQHGFSQPVHDHRGIMSIFCFARSQVITPRDFYEKAGSMLWLTYRTHALLAQSLLTTWRPPILLTPRERETLKWSAEGKTAAEIAVIIELSERTVNFHIQSAIRKLGVKNKMAAVIQAVNRRLL